MKPSLYALALTITISLPLVSQNSAASPGRQQSAPPPNTTSPEEQSPPRRAAGSTKDHSGTSTDQAAKLSEPKDRTTLIGCLSGPDTNGKFTLQSMSHRTGVEVLGPENLKDDSGSKVKLTGSWKPGEQPAVKGKEPRKFQASEVEVMAQKCEAPSEKAPVSKQKEEKKKNSVGVNGDTASPK